MVLPRCARFPRALGLLFLMRKPSLCFSLGARLPGEHVSLGSTSPWDHVSLGSTDDPCVESFLSL